MDLVLQAQRPTQLDYRSKNHMALPKRCQAKQHILAVWRHSSRR